MNHLHWRANPPKQWWDQFRKPPRLDSDIGSGFETGTEQIQISSHGVVAGLVVDRLEHARPRIHIESVYWGSAENTGLKQRELDTDVLRLPGKLPG